jgi:hypothetical protein
MSEFFNKVVFFAEVSDEMKEYKENLIKELEHLGCRIKKAYESDLENEHIREIIEQCDASVHILGDHDFSIQPSGKGMEELQINYSVQHFLGSRLLTDQPESRFKIFAWHRRSSDGNIFVEEHLSNHLKKIQQLDEVEFVRSNFENFKSYLIRQIKNQESEESEEFYIKGSKNFNIYFVHDSSDRAQAEKYIEYLNQRGFKVFIPSFDSDIISSRQIHENYLKKFDIALIFAENASINWINMKVMDILKAPGLGREKEITGSAILTSSSNANSIPLANRGFEIISTESGTVKSRIDQILHKLIL